MVKGQVDVMNCIDLDELKRQMKETDEATE